MRLNGYGFVPDNSLVVFTGTHCSACRQLEKTLSMSDISPIQYISVEEYSQTANMYEVMSIPAILIIKNGIIKSSIVGSVTIREIKAEISD